MESSVTWRTIRKAGSCLDRNSLPRRKPSGIAASFLGKVVDGLAKECFAYFDYVDELPFTYRERQIQSVMLPSIAKTADVAFVEQPIYRNSKDGLKRGRIDYWILYQRYVFLVELKHSWISLDSGKVRKETIEAWTNASQQVRSIGKSAAKELTMYPDKILKIAMMIVPCYQSALHASNLTPIDRSPGRDLMDRLTRSLRPAPNWSCVWALHQRLQTVYEYAGERKEMYPFVVIAARVEAV